MGVSNFELRDSTLELKERAADRMLKVKDRLKAVDRILELKENHRKVVDKMLKVRDSA